MIEEKNKRISLSIIKENIWNNLMQDEEYHDKLFFRDFWENCSHLNASQVNQLEIMIKAMQAFHGDNFDICIHAYRNISLYLNDEQVTEHYVDIDSINDLTFKVGGFGFIIPYPEVTITNSEGFSHDIVDLYVLLSVYKFDDSFSFEVSLSRSTLYNVELAGSYWHSHAEMELRDWGDYYDIDEDIHDNLDPLLKAIHEQESTGFSPACLGTSDLSHVVANFLLTPCRTIEEFDLMFQSLIATINSYVHWESLEGQPYMTIKYLFDDTLGEITEEWLLCRLREEGRYSFEYKKLFDAQDLSKLKFTISNNTLVLKNPEIIESLLPLDFGHSGHYYKKGVIDEKGDFRRFNKYISAPNFSGLSSTYPIFYYRAKPVYLKTIETPVLEEAYDKDAIKIIFKKELIPAYKAYIEHYAALKIRDYEQNKKDIANAA